MTQVSIQVNADPVKTLQCAYETLLSMRTTMISLRISKKDLEEANHIDEGLLFANVLGIFKPKGISPDTYACLITVEKITDNFCRLTIIVDNTFGVTLGTITPARCILLISDFLKQFKQNLNS